MPLSTNIRTHILELTKDREIPITTEQYNAIKASQQLDRWNDPLEIHDPDTGKILHDWLMKDILGFREIEKSNHVGSKYVCDFAIRHPISEECKCSVNYRKFPVDFRMKAWELYQKYPIQLSDSQRISVLNATPKF